MAAKKKTTKPATSSAPTRRELYMVMGMVGCSYPTAARILAGEDVRQEGTKQVVLRAFDWIRENGATLRLAVQP